MVVVLPFPRTERRQEVALKEYQVVTETDQWRTAVVDAVTEATGKFVSTNTLTYTERDKERWAISAAEREGDDAWLMRYLKQFCPDDPHIEGYPGPDERTTKWA
jgi:glyceraldehyde-3-phosphate dehydrogenase/erythrose-4-phosphate dehydrogenase